MAQLAILEPILVAYGTPALVRIRSTGQEAVSVFPGRLDDTAAIVGWVLELLGAESARPNRNDWLRSFLSESLPVLQRGLEEAIEVRKEVTHVLTVGRFARECIRLEQSVAGRSSNDVARNASQIDWASESSLAHARADLQLSAVGHGPGDARHREALLGAARLRLRVARTLAGSAAGG